MSFDVLSGNFFELISGQIVSFALYRCRPIWVFWRKMTSSVAVASTLSEPGKYGRSPRLHDSGVGSFGSESDTSPIGVHSTMAPVVGHARSGDYDNDRVLTSLSSVSPDSFTVFYLGEYTLDRRYTQSMLPWVMAEVRIRGTGQMVSLVVEQALLRARSLNLNQVLFEHKLQTMTRFAKTLRDVRCFSYLTRANVDAAFTCHVYQAEDEGTVSENFNIRRRLTEGLCFFRGFWMLLLNVQMCTCFYICNLHAWYH